MNVEWLTLENVFWVGAIGGTVFFTLRTIMMFLGGDFDGDMDGLDGDMDTDTHSDAAFALISINTLTAFVMMFGWSGLTAYKQFGLSNVLALLVATTVGVIAMFITASLFSMASRLVSKGAQFKIEDTIGMTANVYQEIPADGRGRVNVSMSGGILKELDAVSADKVDIASFKTVKVVKVIDNKTVAVKQI